MVYWYTFFHVLTEKNIITTYFEILLLSYNFKIELTFIICILFDHMISLIFEMFRLFEFLRIYRHQTNDW